jgi:TatD DNase family protein
LAGFEKSSTDGTFGGIKKILSPELYSRLDEIISEEMKKPSSERKLVAIGEIGHDFHYEGYSRELQELYFERQMEMAQRYDLPVIIHDRDAHGPCFDMALKFPKVRGVFHSFSGSAEMAKELVKRGWYISFSGVLTFKNAARVRAVAESVPLERVLIETDAPYLAPHPHRGELNHSGLMEFTARTLAEVKGITSDEAAQITYKNAAELFGI